MSSEHKKESGVSDVESPRRWFIRANIVLATGVTYSMLRPILRQKIVNELYQDEFELHDIKVTNSDIEFTYTRKEKGMLVKDDKDHLLNITKEALEFEKKEHYIQSYKITTPAL
ncbi:hypothetical protein CE143_11580 [Photorhabdus luminescens]|uniref:Uncharacterized protein n=1 Tax=Photorhabdus akhurstii TaxID=171438 RepID=A0ABX8LX23_9GAMM|nr:hypothetical protein [Photorhabdus akhurstii]KGM29818.1 hypothetical protein KS18_02850 [Photorhabdus luminescens]MBS9427171.1 hypothetical protein [Photorhabdus akhurstii]QXF33713.1 hypothetical protein B0X70_11580 [Photorhabdus akhurstii]UJD75528.1 hypothetical protein CE143_11580 [Photorhabdus luminescens]